MRVTMRTNAAGPTGSMNSGKTYEVEEEQAMLFVRLGYASATEDVSYESQEQRVLAEDATQKPTDEERKRLMAKSKKALLAQLGEEGAKALTKKELVEKVLARGE